MSKLKRLQLVDVHAYYRQLIGSREVHVRAVDGVTLEVESGEVLGLVGESGCGKSTLAKVVMMQVNPPLELIKGQVVLRTREGKELNLEKIPKRVLKREVWGKHVSLVPQEAMSSLMPTIKIKQIAYDVLRSHLDSATQEEAESILRQRLSNLGLPEHIVNRYPFELSGGMAQRTVIAVATLLNPEVLLVDEPTSALDVVTQKQVLTTLYELIKKRIVDSMIFISHDIATVRQIASRIAVMYAGKLVEVAQTEDIIHDPAHPYTRGLIESVATLEPEVRARGLKYIPGQPPDLVNPPPGCRFADRCPAAFDPCKKQEPPLERAGNRMVACWLYTKR